MKKLLTILAIAVFFAGCKTTKPEPISPTLATPLVSEETGESYASAVTPMEIESWDLVGEHPAVIPINQFMGFPVVENYYVNPDPDAPIRYGCVIKYVTGEMIAYAFMYQGDPYRFNKNDETNTWENREITDEQRPYWINDFVEYGKYVPVTNVSLLMKTA